MKEKQPFTRTQKLLEILSFTIMVASIIYLCVNWSLLPDTLASHYNASGQPDAWSSKGSILALPIISAFLYILLTGLLFLPIEMLNSPVEVTKSNRMYIQKLTRDLLSLLKLVMICNFSYMNLCTILEKPLTPLFLPIFLLLTFVPIIVCIVKMFKSEKRYKD